MTLANTDRLGELVGDNAEPARLGSGFAFTEGPIWDKAKGCLYFSDMPGDVRRRWSEGGGVEVVRRPNNKGNGMTLDAAGAIIVCEHTTSSVVREGPAGRQVLASHHEGKELNSPNDVVVADDGAIYFTDPTYGRMEGFGVERPQQLSFQGVYRVEPATGHLGLLADDFEQPNGLCFSPDGRRLYVNDSPRAHVRAFTMAPDGGLDGGELFCEGIGSGKFEEGMPDGMKCDEHGNVWVSGPDGIWVFGPSGAHLGVLEVPEVVGNFNWGGSAWNDLFVCATTSLYRYHLNVAGARSAYMR